MTLYIQMAYRLPERRERDPTGPPPSYLDDFLDKVEPLPNTIKSLCHEIRSLDDKINSIVTESSAVVTEAVTRATTKGVPLENVKRTLHDFVHLQASASEYAERKHKLASEARDCIQEKIEEIDKRLVEFEKQLRKEGRWPREEEEVVKTLRAKAPAHLVDRNVKATEKLVKGRRATQPTTPRAAALAARAEEKEKEKEEKKQDDGDEEMIDDSQILYCTCRGVSHGNMVACENKDCEYEWFHFGCVGLTSEPKGAWYCDSCAAALRLKKKSSGGRRK